jgi:cell shape-determining protein MreC
MPRAGEHDAERAPAKPGDLVLSVPDALNLPGALQIGVVREVARREDNPLEYRLKVAPAVDYGSLKRLFVVDPSSYSAGKEGR